MAVRLRLQRHGAKKRPFYRVVATDKRNPRDGRFIELLGTYDPLQEPPVIRLKAERVDYWLGVGAQPSETVNSIIQKLRDGKGVDLSAEGADKAAAAERREARQQSVQERRDAAAKAAQDAEKAKADEAKAAKAAEAEEAKAAEAPAGAEGEEGEEAGAENAPEAQAEPAAEDAEAATKAGDEG